MNPKYPDRELIPLKKQLDFMGSESFITYFAGGWGSAKSTALAAGIASLLHQNVGLTGVLILPTLAMCHEFITTQLLPMAGGIIESWSKYEHAIYVQGGGRIKFAGAADAAGVRRIEQINAAWAAADEVGLMPKEILFKIAARVRDERADKPGLRGNNRRMLFAGTPHYGWLKDEFEGRDDSERRIIHASTRENPHLPADYISNLAASCPARLAKAYIEGHFVPPGGTVYAEFDPEVHVVPWEHRSDCPTVASIDWSPRVPHVIVAQLLPEGATVAGRKLKKLVPGHAYAGAVIVDEIVLDGAHVAITREVLLHELIKRNYALDHFICDPAGGAVQSSTTITDIRRATEMLAVDARMPHGQAARSIQAGVAHVQNMFKPMDEMPRLYFAKAMVDRVKTYARSVQGRASINAIMSYGYPEDGTSSQPVKDGVSDHFCDCLRYLVVVHFAADRLLQTVKQVA